MEVQVFGLIMATVCAICGTAIIITSIRTKRNNQFRAEQAERDRKQTAWNKTFECEAIALYEDEKNKREAAETKVLILEQQLRNARELLGKVKVADV